MTERDEAMQRRAAEVAEALQGRGGGGVSSVRSFDAKLHPHDREGKFRETFGRGPLTREEHDSMIRAAKDVHTATKLGQNGARGIERTVALTTALMAQGAVRQVTRTGKMGHLQYEALQATIPNHPAMAHITDAHVRGGTVAQARRGRSAPGSPENPVQPSHTPRRRHVQEAKFGTDERKKLASKGVAMPDGSYPIRNARDLGNAVQALGRASDPAAAKRHIIKRAKALGCAHKLPDDWNVQEAGMHPTDRDKLIDRQTERRLIAEAAQVWGLTEAADSLAKASTPEPFSTSKTSNWIARNGGLPDYIQHVAHGIVRSGKPVSEAIRDAIGIVKRWARGGGGVDAGTKAAAAKAIAEWEALKARNKARKAA